MQMNTETIWNCLVTLERKIRVHAQKRHWMSGSGHGKRIEVEEVLHLKWETAYRRQDSKVSQSFFRCYAIFVGDVMLFDERAHQFLRCFEETFSAAFDQQLFLVLANEMPPNPACLKRMAWWGVVHVSVSLQFRSRAWNMEFLSALCCVLLLLHWCKGKDKWNNLSGL